MLPGLIARALYPDINGDDAYPMMVVKLLPTGMVGFMVAALMAALMSSLAAAFNSASTLVTFDVYRVLRPAATERQLVQVGRIVTVVMVALSMLWVPFIRYLSTEVYIYLQSVQAYISPPIAAVFLIGVFWPRANRYGAIAALVTGAVLGALRFIFELNKGIGARVGIAAAVVVRRHQLPALRDRAVRGECRAAGRRVARHAPESLAKLRGLTFATLDNYRPREAQARSMFTLQIVATVALALFTIGLWVHFA